MTERPAASWRSTTPAASSGRVEREAGDERRALRPVRPVGAAPHTRIMASGPLAAGTVTGSLFLVGGGDPSLATKPFARAAHGGDGTLVSDLAAAIAARGISPRDRAAVRRRERLRQPPDGPVLEAELLAGLPADLGALGERGSLPPRPSTGVLEPAALRRTDPEEVAQEPRRRLREGPARARPSRHRLGGRHDGRRRTCRGSSARWTSCPTTTTPRCSPRRSPSTPAFAARPPTARSRPGAASASLGVKLRGASIVDGSGLSLGDHLSARQILGILRRAARQSWGFYLHEALPVAGVSGTLRYRMRSGPAHGNAHAKTGHARHGVGPLGLRPLGQRPPARVLDPPEPPAAPRRARRPPAPGRHRAAPGRVARLGRRTAARPRRRSSSARSITGTPSVSAFDRLEPPPSPAST